MRTKTKMQAVTVGSFALDGKKTASWAQRCPAIATILRSSALDAYLLQEVSSAQMDELASSLRNLYVVIHFAHPTSTGGVAVLLRRERLALVHQARLPFWAKGALPDCFMCAAIAFARDRVSGARLLIASTVRARDSLTSVRDDPPPPPRSRHLRVSWSCTPVTSHGVPLPPRSRSTTTRATWPRRRTCWSTWGAHAEARMPPWWQPAPTSHRSTWPSGVARRKGSRRAKAAHCRLATRPQLRRRVV